MSIETVLVSGQLYNPDGSPAANAELRFTLSGLGIVGLSLLVPRFAVAQCDAAGAFAFAVVPNPAGTHYDVRAGRDGALLFTGRAVVPGNNCQLTQIMDALPVPSLSAAEQALLDLQAAQAEIEADRQSAAASAASALQAVDAPGRVGPQGPVGPASTVPGPVGPAGPPGILQLDGGHPDSIYGGTTPIDGGNI